LPRSWLPASLISRLTTTVVQVGMWMQAPGHKQQLVDPAFTHMAVAVASDVATFKTVKWASLVLIGCKRDYKPGNAL
jgi:hypothetical protein